MKLNSLSSRSAAAVREAEVIENVMNANLREIAEKREKSQNQQRSSDRPPRGIMKENAGFARRGGDDDMDVDEPNASTGGGGAKGKNRKSVYLHSSVRPFANECYIEPLRRSLASRAPREIVRKRGIA